MGEHDREPSDFPLRAPDTHDEKGAPQTTARTGLAASVLGVTGLAVLVGIGVLVIVVLVLAL